MCCLLIWANVTRAQPNDFGNWIMYFGTNGFAKKWVYHNEFQYRNYNFTGDLEQMLIRTGLGINLTENNNTLLSGFGYIRSENYSSNRSDKYVLEEHRVFQQFITKQRFGRFNIQHRYRLEERFLPNNFKIRFRYFLSFNIPLNKIEMQRGSFYLSVYNEIFIHKSAPHYDRNRLYGALGYVLTMDLRFEMGAMSQILENRQRPQLQIAFFNTLPFRKRNKE